MVAGLVANDVIVRMDGEDVWNCSQEEVVGRIQRAGEQPIDLFVKTVSALPCFWACLYGV